MRIYKMTAAFGKLEHETLALQPGLNIIEAPNEWGKSTWCAFLTAMLFGLDTRAKSTKTALADKERFAPWSGSPMSGRIDLCWQGRDITIERQTRRRVPLGEFRAYETQSGLPVPELTAANCGEKLLGVEQSVFRRAGFIRFADLPVTQDDALRRRLNALVTTGDESGDGERLSRQLRELKNRCRYNRSGLLPQAEEERRAAEGKLQELQELTAQSDTLKQRLAELDAEGKQLENHLDSLAYAAALADAERLARARDELDRAECSFARLEKETACLPSREQAEEKLRKLKSFSIQWSTARMEEGMLPPPPLEPEIPEPFDAPQPEAMLEADECRYQALSTCRELGWYLAAAAGVLAGVGLLIAKLFVPAGAAIAWAVLALCLALAGRRKRRREKQALEKKYLSSDPEQWRQRLQSYRREKKEYAVQMAQYRRQQGDLEERLLRLKTERASLCAGQTPEQVMELWQQVVKRWDDFHTARREAQRAQSHYEALSAMVRTAPPPAMSDDLPYSRADTEKLLEDVSQNRHRLQHRLGQYQGRMEALGRREELEKELTRIGSRIRQLEDTYAALTIAQETLAQARQTLQRRFAPRITRRARELMARMTGGRYDRLTLDEDFSLRAGAAQEQTLQSILWRSDGTMDQMYLSLRLAVAEELTAHAPLVLDDALVRFDDTRAKAALELLQELAQERQILLFTCQTREKNLLKQ